MSVRESGSSSRAARGGAIGFGLVLFLALPPQGGAEAAEAELRALCKQSGVWIETGPDRIAGTDEVIAAAAESSVVLLGESHGDPDTHRWELHVMAALHGHRPNMVLGFEMFPRAVQPALDRWVAGALDEDAFLEEARWSRSWNISAAEYLPLFHFARMHRLAMQALNVDRSLIGRVASEGWRAVPESERQGVGDPVPASPAYRTWLRTVFDHKRAIGAEAGREGSSGSSDDQEQAFEHFVQAQQTWDRAMAEGLLTAREARPDALAVGVMGRGHVEYRYGVAAQLDDLDAGEVTTLLAVREGDDCVTMASEDSADWLFVLAEARRRASSPPPKLGVIIDDSDGKVRVREVLPDSVADAATLAVGDIVVTAAGIAVMTTDSLIRIIQRQSPGTWLPLQVERQGRVEEIIARFPSSQE